MFDELSIEADLSGYTDEEIERAKEIHAENCVKNCSAGPFRGIVDPYGWLNWARRDLKRRPQSETLF